MKKGSRLSAETRKLISESLRRLWANPDVRERRTEAIRKARAKPEVRKRTIRGLKRSWADPEVHQRRTAINRRIWENPEVRKRAGAAHKRAWANPEVRKRRTEGIRKALAKPAVRKRITATLKRSWANNPTGRQQQSERSKRVWAERLSRLAAALPADWRDKPLLWRIIGMELLSQDHMSNRTLASRLDNATIVRCPYAETWGRSVEARKVTVLINRIRKWVRKPGTVKG